MRIPGWAKGGKVAVTMTAAVLVTRIAVAGTEMPIRDSRFVRLWAENVVWKLSPFPARPTTRP
jgi:hypothetical protein